MKTIRKIFGGVKKIRIKKQWLVTVLIYIFAIAAASGIVYFQYRNDMNNVALAGTGDNIHGWAWSSNIGWISMNCSETGSCAPDYGVALNTTWGNLSGYAWSSNVGWINFGSAGNTCPSAPLMNISTGAVSGYAQIVSMGADGCIKLSDDTIAVWTGKGVKFDSGTGEFAGWGWNANSDGSGIGWVSFNCSNESTCGTVSYKVSLGSAPTAPSGVTITESTASSDPCKTVTVSWTDNSSDETGFVVETSPTNSNPWTTFCPASPVNPDVTQCINSISPSTLFYFRVKAKGAIQDSGYATASKTIGYCAPELDNVDTLSGNANCEHINLSWSQTGLGSGINHYEVWRSVNSDPAARLADDIPNTTFTYQDTDIDTENGSKYSYYIKAQTTGIDSNTIGPINPCPKAPKWKEKGSQ